jgi:hypothetical protein
MILAISKDDQLLRRLNELDQAETCSTSGKGGDAKWGMDPQNTLEVVSTLANASASVNGNSVKRSPISS